jgi:hypothetical protein
MPFDRPEHALGNGKDDDDFNKDDTCKMTASIPKCADPSMSPQVMVKYYLHRHGQDDSILAGSSVLSWESVCPPFESCPNQNLFQQFFGIEFHYNDHTYVHAISTYEFTRCFGLVDNIQYRMSHERYKFGLDASMPGRTSSWLFDQVHSHLLYLRDANCKVFCPISLLLRRPQSRHSLMALSALAFPPGRDGSKHILTTQSCAQFGTSR